MKKKKINGSAIAFKCSQKKEFLNYYSGEASAEEKEKFEAHLKDCKACQIAVIIHEDGLGKYSTRQFQLPEKKWQKIKNDIDKRFFEFLELAPPPKKLKEMEEKIKTLLSSQLAPFLEDFKLPKKQDKKESKKPLPLSGFLLEIHQDFEGKLFETIEPQELITLIKERYAEEAKKLLKKLYYWVDHLIFYFFLKTTEKLIATQYLKPDKEPSTSLLEKILGFYSGEFLWMNESYNLLWEELETKK